MEGADKSVVEMELSKIRIDEKRGEQLVVLREKAGKRLLPIVIGILEVNAIKIKLSGAAVPRPLTHDLLNEMIMKLGGSFDRMIIEKLENNTFYAKLVLKKADGEFVDVDARPSDGIALALRARAPIYVAEEVLRRAGFEE